MFLYSLQTVAAASSVVALWFLGNRGPWGARAALLSILIWWGLIAVSGYYDQPLWGIAPIEAVKTVVAIRNLIKAEREQRRGT